MGRVSRNKHIRSTSCFLCLSLLCAICLSSTTTAQAIRPPVHLFELSSSAVLDSLSVYERLSAILEGLFKPIELIRTLNERVIEVGTRHDSSSRTVRVAVVSDLNGSYGSTSYKMPVHRAIDALVDVYKPSLVLSTGDMVAGMKEGLDYEAMWHGFHAAVTRPLRAAHIPFAPTPGNHDGTNRPGFEAERAMYNETWRRYKPDLNYVDDKHYPRRYAYLHEGVLFVSIDASTVGKLSSSHRKWLESVLRKQRDVKTKIVYGHVPLYPFAQKREREILDDKPLEEMFVKYGVTLYLSGHHHAYYPGKRENGLRLVSMACLGGGPRVLLGTSEPSPRALLIMEIEPDRGIASLEAYHTDDFTLPVDRAILPSEIGEGDWLIRRDDL